MSFPEKKISSRENQPAAGGLTESRAVVFPGAKQSVWAGVIKSNASYNSYNVRIVEIGSPGSIPVEISKEFQAVNLAEDFLEQGQLPARRYVVLSRIGQKYVFYAS